MSQTFSEKQFERACKSRAVHCRRLPPRKGQKTADYILRIANTTVITEIKQITLNDSNKLILSQIKEGKVVGYFPQGAHRLRTQIKKGKLQLKETAKGRCPTILVVYDDTLGIDDLDHSDFYRAMYGSSGLLSPHRTTHISALGCLRRQKYSDGPEIVLYHNFHADFPLDFELARRLSERQFYLKHPPSEFSDRWTPA